MSRSATDLSEELRTYGALPGQLVDVSSDDEPRVLKYLDLRAESQEFSGWQPPVVVEHNERPYVHIFDARGEASDEQIDRWCWRIALRGDGAWIGVLEPGRLRVFRADVADNLNLVRPKEEAHAEPGNLILTRFLADVGTGQDDMARRKQLLALLEESARQAVDVHGLSPNDALSLVGRGLFWRFLVDRGLLASIKFHEVCEGARGWKECLDTKTRALRTFKWLDTTFNGGLLPFECNTGQFPAALFSDVLGNIAHGTTPTGQLRLPATWAEMNFAYVPVGLLSEVYEAFAHNINAQDATEKSIHYTPSHLVDFIVAQVLEGVPRESRLRVLDPAAGAGVFLVTVFRKLVEREWSETGRRPERGRIREILNKQLVGFDIDGRALRLAELALYLTALELDPKPKPLNALKFEELRDNVLFDLSGTEHGSLGPIEDRFRSQFDLVIGNPPWTAKPKGTNEKSEWSTYTHDVAAKRLNEDRAKTFTFPGTKPDLPFIWRAMEWAKEGGHIAMITHARWLFGLSPHSVTARNDLLSAVRVTGILNGSALRFTNVWPEVSAPWCVVFATNVTPLSLERSAFQFVSPSLDFVQDRKQSRMRIDWPDAQKVAVSEVVDRPWTLKTRFRGNRLAARAFESMDRRGARLGAYLEDMGAKFANGYKVSDGVVKRENARHMEGMFDTKGVKSLGFIVNVDALPIFKRSTLARPRARSIYNRPLLLVTERIASDRFAVRVSRSEHDLAYHQSYHGVSFSGVRDADLIARYLQLYLQSSVLVFVELLIDGRYGVERDVIYRESLDRLPIMPLEDLDVGHIARIRDLSDRLTAGISDDLANAIDAFILDTFNLSNVERAAIRDTVDTALPSAASKRRAVAPPTDEECTIFIDTFTDSLDSVLSASRLRTMVRECLIPGLASGPWKVLEVCISRDGSWSDAELPVREFLEEADKNGASLVVVRPDETTWMIGLMKLYKYWTPTRARLLANDIIAARSSL